MANACIVIFSFVLMIGANEDSSRKNSVKSLNTAVSKVNKKLLKNRDSLDREIIEQSKILKGKFKVRTRVLERTDDPDGAVVLSAETRVNMGKAERFLTEEERRAKADAFAMVKDAKKKRRLAGPAFREQWKRTRGKDSPLLRGRQHPGWVHFRTRIRITDAEYERRLNEIIRKAEEAVVEAQRNMNDVAGPINERINELKLAVDKVKLDIVFPPKVARKVDFVRLMALSNPTLIVKVTDYSADKEPDEGGGRLHISDLKLKVVDVSKRLKKKKKKKKR